MGKKAIRKDFYLEIRKSVNRFLSIFLIVALGVAFFSGIRASEPDMQLSADKYFDEFNLMDIRVISTYGLTHEDLEKIKDVNGIKEVQGVYTYDVLSETKEDQMVLKLQSFSDQVNKVKLSEGRFPKLAKECVIDEALAGDTGYSIGDVITVKAGSGDVLEDYIDNNEYTVVGIGTTPYYLSLERESTTIGNGTVNGFVIVPEENFCMEYYTEADILVDGAKEKTSYTKKYKKLVDTAVDQIEDITKERCEVRYDSIMEEANQSISDAQIELTDAKEKAEKKLSDGWDKLVKAKQDMKEAKQKITDGEKELAEGKTELSKAEDKLAEGRTAYNQGKTELSDAREEFEKGRKELEKQKKELASGKAELNEKEDTLTAARNEIEKKKAELEAAKAYLSEEEYNAMLSEITKQEQIIIEGESAIAAGKKTIKSGEEELAKGELKLQKAEESLLVGEDELLKAQSDLVSGENEIKNAKHTIEENEQKILDGKAEIEDGEVKIEKSEKKYWEGKEEAELKIEDAEAELSDAKEKIQDLKEPEWYVLSREKMQVIEEFGQNAERIGAIGEVFPVMFFLVAALVCLTTMTRMVEEQRTQIGTLKALGYGKGAIAAKYLLYAGLASVSGGIFGAIVGQKVLPMVVIAAYRILYNNFPYTLLPFNYYYGISSIVIVCGCTIFAAYFACTKEMHESAAQLMRPESPKAGKRVLLERLFIWKHLSFTQKASIRNLLRYKKRFFMTVIGIAGCMALLLVGYGVRDSIFNIAQMQYERLFKYSGSVSIKDDASKAQREKLLTFLNQDESIEKEKLIYQTSVTISTKEKEKTGYLIVPQTEEEFQDFIHLTDRKTHESYKINLAGEGVLLTEKVAALLDVSVGDTISLKISDTQKEEVIIRGIVENYAMHYVYMLRETYESLFKTNLKTNLILFNYKPDTVIEEEALGESVLAFKAASQISFSTQNKESIEGMMDSLDIVVWVLIISAGLLAFVVLYNLNNININERKRELATLKVLGFYDTEVASYVYRENIMLSLIGTLAGVFFGMVLHRFVILTAEVDMLMFGRNIDWKSYLYSAGFTMLFSLLINWIMYYKLKKINMVESLKSIE